MNVEIKCDSNEEAIELLKLSKEFFQKEATREPYNAMLVNLNLSFMDAVEAYLSRGLCTKQYTTG